MNAKEAQDFRREIQPLLTPFGIMPNQTSTLAKNRTILFQPDTTLFFDPEATLITPAFRALPDLWRLDRLPDPRRPRTPGPPRITRARDVNPYDILPKE
ncbi:MAG: hypothetical protein AAF491_00070 [Verrucomicrobiota bacterium]